MKKTPLTNISQTSLMLITSIVFMLFYNFSFYNALIKVFPLTPQNIFNLVTLAIATILMMFTVFQIISNRFTNKIIFGIIFVVSSFAAYFMDTYSIVIDVDMIRSMIQTDISESMDLFSLKLVFYVGVLGILPAYIFSKVNVNYKSCKLELLSKLKTITLSLAIIAIIVVSLSKFYTSFLREHKSLRYYENPLEWINSIGKYVKELTALERKDASPLGTDALIRQEPDNRKRIVVMVVGEALRADHFGLNGYKPNTTPLLSKRNDIINFPNFYSCGTSTAYSVPCMFSVLDRKHYDHNKALEIENVIDVLSHTKKIGILWIDNNSSPKGVMDRIGYKTCSSDNLIKPEKNKKQEVMSVFDRIDQFSKESQKEEPLSDEYKDTCLLEKAKNFINKNPAKDLLLILHMKGSHGPQYFKRYSKKFENFTPTCKTNQLAECSQKEIANAYDNTVLYSDFVLSQTIQFLQTQNPNYDTALIYMADHGESLGEQNIYLHGIPYKIAPDAQKHTATFMWFSNTFTDFDIEKIKDNSHKYYSHDNLFSTLLGIFNVQTKVYDKKMDMTRPE